MDDIEHLRRTVNELAYIRKFIHKNANCDGIEIVGANGRDWMKWLDRVDALLGDVATVELNHLLARLRGMTGISK